MSETEQLEFHSLDLKPEILKALDEKGYTHATPIQTESIPYLLEGRDLLGQAQTGTGKTAAFALPILNKITNDKRTQVLILAPTRELAGQVADAIMVYSKFMPGIEVLSLYGGQGYNEQLRGLRKGAQICVGTPGRVMDHLRQKTLKIDALDTLILDEADEMLRMGFVDDVEWILEHTPKDRQTVLFSATMPTKVKHMSTKYMNNPKYIHVKTTTQTGGNIRQRALFTKASMKLDALWRILETEEYDAVMIFSKTKAGTHEVADFLNGKGIKAEALNGDLPQETRERLVDRLKKGSLDIIAATDVAARGLDVQRITHVVNFDLPSDVESYVHRIGRTGRAGRSGDALSLATFRQKRFLDDVRRETKANIEEMAIPDLRSINAGREARLEEYAKKVLENSDLEKYEVLAEKITEDLAIDPIRLLAAFIKMTQGEKDLWITQADVQDHAREEFGARAGDKDRGGRGERGGRERGGRDRDRSERGGCERGGRDRDRGDRGPRESRPDKEIPKSAKPLKNDSSIEMERFRIDLGYQDQVKPGQIVGAIANEADISSDFIGHIELNENYSTVDLPSGMPKEIMTHLHKVKVNGKALKITKFI